MIADRIFARRRLRSGDEEDSILRSGGERRVKIQPLFSLIVPIFERFFDGEAEFRVVVEGPIGRVVDPVRNG